MAFEVPMRRWDGTDDRGNPLSAGVYWSQLRTDDYEGSRKMVVLE